MDFGEGQMHVRVGGAEHEIQARLDGPDVVLQSLQPALLFAPDADGEERGPVSQIGRRQVKDDVFELQQLGSGVREQMGQGRLFCLGKGVSLPDERGDLGEHNLKVGDLVVYGLESPGQTLAQRSKLRDGGADARRQGGQGDGAPHAQRVHPEASRSKCTG